MPPIPRFAWYWSITGLILESAFALVPKFPVAVFCFYFFVCWILWYVAAWIEISKRAFLRLAALWMVIDLSILVCFLFVVHSLGDISNSQGTEIVWGIAYLPSILPVGFGLGFYENVIDFIDGQVVIHVKAFLGPAFGSVVGDWLMFSLISFIQCCVVSYLMSVFHRASLWKSGTSRRNLEVYPDR